jgi:hypothetical protein
MRLFLYGTRYPTLRRRSAYEGVRYRLHCVTLRTSRGLLTARAWIAVASINRPWP